MIDDKKREEIKKEAKRILDKFSSSLEKVKFKEKEIEKKSHGYREEGEGMTGNEDFRKRMFENAPEKNKGYIIAEKKKW